MSDEPAYRRTLQQFIELFIEPEIKRRHELGLVPSLPMPLSRAQVILPGDGGAAIIRLNDEVQAKARVVVKPGVSTEPGSGVGLQDLTQVEHLELFSPEDENAGHITVIWHGDQVFMSFDFRYNKALASQLVAVSREFLEAARYAKDTLKSWSVFVENLFACVELSIKAFLWTTAWGKDLKARMTHMQIRSTFAKFPIEFNGLQSKADTLELLAKERNSARYLHSRVNARWDDGELWFNDGQEMLERAEAQVKLLLRETPTAATGGA